MSKSVELTELCIYIKGLQLLGCPYVQLIHGGHTIIQPLPQQETITIHKHMANALNDRNEQDR
jgi:hypothetical protein